MSKLKILFVTPEALPFLRISNLSDFVYNITRKYRDLNHCVKVVMPLFKSIKSNYKESLRYITSFRVDLGYDVHTASVLKLDVEGVEFLFIESDTYFDRERVYGEIDDAERFIFFNKSVMLMLKHIEFKPDIIHLNDYTTALIAAYIKNMRQVDDFYSGIKTVMTFHNIRKQGIYPSKDMDLISGLPMELIVDSDYQYFGSINLVKAGIVSSDFITFPSPTFREEVCLPYYGEKLDRLLRANSFKTAGILDGIDFRRYDPAKDPFIFQNFDEQNLEKRKINKQGIMNYYSLRDYDRPLFSIISKIVNRKGIDLILDSIDYMVEKGANIIIMGTGIPTLEDALIEKEMQYPDHICVKLYQNEKEAIRIMAGSDFFVMPSRTEIQATNHLIAMRYGSIPIVRETGTLKDGVKEYNKFSKKGEGILFSNLNGREFRKTIDKAIELYRDKPEILDEMRLNGLKKDSSWEAAANVYLEIYKELSENQ